MSLIRPVIRLAAVAALRSQTWAEQRVMDSDMTPLVDALRDGPAKPYIVVYTDDDVRSECSGMEVYASRRDLSLTLEMGIASATDAQGGDGAVLNFPQTDASMELAMDMLELQAFHALFGNSTSRWRELLLSVILSVRRVPSVRGGAADKGTRWAARQTTFIIQPVGDLVPGVIPDELHWSRRFVALAAGHDDVSVAKAAELVAKVIETTQAPDWRVAQSWLGITDEGIRAIGLAPFGIPDEVAPELSELTLSIVDDEGGAASVTITEEEAVYAEPAAPPFDPGAAHFGPDIALVNSNLFCPQENNKLSWSGWFKVAIVPGTYIYRIIWVSAPVTEYYTYGGYIWQPDPGHPLGEFAIDTEIGSAEEGTWWNTQAGLPPGDVWHHVLFSGSGFGDSQLLIDRVPVQQHPGDPMVVTTTGMHGKQFVIGHDIYNQGLGDISLADLWVAPGVDLRVDDVIPVSVLNKFITPGGRPVYLGKRGERPTGIPPAVFHSGGATTFGKNRGTGGPAVVNHIEPDYVYSPGVLTDAATPPRLVLP